MQQPYMVADILQLPQVVGSDDRRQVSLLHVTYKNTFHCLPHHRVQSVKCLVTEQIIRPGTHAADHGNLFFHTFGKCIDLPFPVQFKAVHQMDEPVFIEFRVNAHIKLHQLLRSGIAEKILIIGNIEKP